MTNYLKPKEENIKTKSVIGFDIETYGDKNKFLMGSFVDEKNKYIFWNKQEMIDFVIKSKILESKLVFATNLSFDFMGLFGDDFKLLSKFRYIIRGSDFIMISYKHKSGKRVTFLDTMNYIRFSVFALGKILGLPKLDKPDFLGTYVYKDSVKGKQLQDYNIRDSYISFKFGEFIQKAANEAGTNLKFTVASTSMSLFQNKYLSKKIAQPERETMENMFKGYYGGRVETFYRGMIDIKSHKDTKYYYDINSLYPHVMKKYIYPDANSLKYKVWDFEKWSDQDKALEVVNKYHGISYCEIEVPENLDIPLLPCKHDNKLLFPSGDFDNYQTHIELRKALKLGYKIKVAHTYYYTYNTRLFENFVTDIYDKRLVCKKNKDTMELFWKIILNSLYGKWAQKLDYSEIFFVDDDKQKDKVDRYVDENIINIQNGLEPRYKIDSPDKRTRILDNGMMIDDSRIYYVTDLESTTYPKFINPIYSIYITSYARLELYKWFEYILSRKGKVYYADTDSVITDIKLPTGKKLGEMKLELTVDKKLILVKPKMYYAESKTGESYCKAKGLHNLKELDKFLNVLYTGHFEFIKFSKFKESIRRNLAFNEKLNIIKDLDFTDNKRKWNTDVFSLKKFEKSKPREISFLDFL